MPSSYHVKKDLPCRYCGEPRKRYTDKFGRNKGLLRTCGSGICRKISAGLPEVVAKKRHAGKDHPLYKKDRSEIKSSRPRYELTVWTKAVFERDNYTCQHCGCRGGRLQADHILPYCLYPDLRWELSNGRTLCVGCHKKTPTYGRKVIGYSYAEQV